MAVERPLKEFLNDIRFLGDATGLLHDIFEGVARELPEDLTITVNLDEEYFSDIEDHAKLLNQGATLDGGGKDVCIPPGPCDSPGGSITTYIGALKGLSTAVTAYLDLVMASVQADNPDFSARVYPQRVLQWKQPETGADTVDSSTTVTPSKDEASDA